MGEIKYLLRELFWFFIGNEIEIRDVIFYLRIEEALILHLRAAF